MQSVASVRSQSRLSPGRGLFVFAAVPSTTYAVSIGRLGPVLGVDTVANTSSMALTAIGQLIIPNRARTSLTTKRRKRVGKLPYEGCRKTGGCNAMFLPLGQARRRVTLVNAGRTPSS